MPKQGSAEATIAAPPDDVVAVIIDIDLRSRQLRSEVPASLDALARHLGSQS